MHRLALGALCVALSMDPLAAHPIDPALSRALAQPSSVPSRFTASIATSYITASPVGELGVLHLRDEALALDPEGWADPQRFTADLVAVGRAAHQALPSQEIDVVVLLTEVSTPRGPVYLPLANDVRGLGYGHLGLAPDEVFRTGALPWIDGVIYLGALSDYRGEGGAIEARYQFLHELGHRWGVYARFMPAVGPPSDAWLGRDCAHWSFFTQSGGSALEGNRWRAFGDGWRVTGRERWGYNDFDRYLMGFAPPEAVAPSFFLPGGWDCQAPRRNGVINPAWRPPVARSGTSAQAEGRARVVTIEQLQAAEGPRRPAWPESQQIWRVVFVVLGSEAALVEAEALRLTLTATWMQEARQPGLAGPLLISHASGQPDVPRPDVGVFEAELDAGLEVDLGPDGGCQTPPQGADLGPDGRCRTPPQAPDLNPDGGCQTPPQAPAQGGGLLALAVLLYCRQRWGAGRRSSK